MDDDVDNDSKNDADHDEVNKSIAAADLNSENDLVLWPATNAIVRVRVSLGA